MDFLTIVFEDTTEIELLKLQAISFNYVQTDNIGTIHIFYNDTGLSKIEHIREYYPAEMRSKVSIVYRDSIMKCNKSSWFNQQYFKLFFCNYVQADHCIVLDSKNHFIRDVGLDDFFCNGKPKLYLNNPGTMIRFYIGCLAYFDVNDPFHCEHDNDFNPTGNNMPLTTTPFIFITSQVCNLIKFIETKESKSLYDFFTNKGNTVTEFYLYTAYLIFSNNLDKHAMVQKDNVVTIFNDPTAAFNTFEKKKIAITNAKVKIFGLHRIAVKKMDNDYKQNLLKLYAQFFDDTTCCMIESILYAQ